MNGPHSLYLLRTLFLSPQTDRNRALLGALEIHLPRVHPAATLGGHWPGAAGVWVWAKVKDREPRRLCCVHVLGGPFVWRAWGMASLPSTVYRFSVLRIAERCQVAVAACHGGCIPPTNGIGRLSWQLQLAPAKPKQALSTRLLPSHWPPSLHPIHLPVDNSHACALRRLRIARVLYISSPANLGRLRAPSPANWRPP